VQADADGPPAVLQTALVAQGVGWAIFPKASPRTTGCGRPPRGVSSISQEDPKSSDLNSRLPSGFVWDRFEFRHVQMLLFQVGGLRHLINACGHKIDSTEKTMGNEKSA
jgi:hypothetical protein